MAKGLNSVQIIGNLGEKPQIRHTQSGIAVANISVAVNYSVKEGDQYVDKVEWIRCVLWDKKAQLVEQYLDKGSSVFLQGRMATRSWTDSEGVQKWSTEVQVQNLIFLDSKQGQKQDRPPSPPAEVDSGGYDPGDDSGQVPF